MDDAVRTDVLRKMRVKSGMGVQVRHAPAALAGLAVDAPGLGAVLVFVERQADVAPRFLEVLAGGKPAAPVWVAYPKGGARAGVDLRRPAPCAACCTLSRDFAPARSPPFRHSARGITPAEWSFRGKCNLLRQG